jgi:DNA polymerase III delta prime subunit
MSDQKPKQFSIVTMGDETRDLLIYNQEVAETDPSKKTEEDSKIIKEKNAENINLYPNFDAILCAGGALQQGYNIEEIMNLFKPADVKIQYGIVESDNQYISMSRIAKYPFFNITEKTIVPDKNVLRVEKFEFYSKNAKFGELFKGDCQPKPQKSSAKTSKESTEAPAAKSSTTAITIKKILENPLKKIDKTDFLIIHDGGNAFRGQKELKNIWKNKQILKNIDTVFLKLFAPIKKYEKTEIWKNVLKDKTKKLIILTTMQDLRLCGAQIGKGLSWEKLLQDFMWQIENNQDLSILKKCQCAIIRIGFEGALVYFPNSRDILLVYDHQRVEGSFEEEFPGQILAKTSIITAIISAKIIADRINKLSSHGEPTDDEAIKEIVKTNIPKAFRVLRELHIRGYEKELEHFGFSTSMETVTNRIFSQKKYAVDTDNPFTSFEENITKYNETLKKGLNPRKWTIINHTRTKSYGAIAYQYTRKEVLSVDDKHSPDFPVYRMGDLITVDRMEIESYQNVRKLMKEYLSNDSHKSPLSIAVFGPPGSGKSFAIKELIKSLGRKDIEEYNLSQFSSPDELHRVFQRIRDYSFKKEVPLVFFDEFDSKLGSDDLGWLRYFIMPMQDGLFFDRVESRPIGRAIFIFGGGIYHKYEDFSKLQNSNNKEDFASRKGPDFISRLRGHINISGCNPVDDDDEIYKIRRALLLRSLLGRKAKQLFVKKKLRIDQNVLRALIKIDRYHHGNRSMQAIIEMSNLQNSKKFEPSALPSENQLNMHVNAKEFDNLVMRDLHYQEIKKLIRSDILKKKDAGLMNFIKIAKPKRDSITNGVNLFVDTIPTLFYAVNYSIMKEKTQFFRDRMDVQQFTNQISEKILHDDVIKQNICNSAPNDEIGKLARDFYSRQVQRQKISSLNKLREMLELNHFELYPQ